MRRYGQWAGNERGVAEDVARCVEEVSQYPGSMLFKQCTRKRGHGHNNEYCRQHAKRYQAESEQ